jgi:hypothetical protein
LVSCCELIRDSRAYGFEDLAARFAADFFAGMFFALRPASDFFAAALIAAGCFAAGLDDLTGAGFAALLAAAEAGRGTLQMVSLASWEASSFSICCSRT